MRQCVECETEEEVLVLALVPNMYGDLEESYMCTTCLILDAFDHDTALSALVDLARKERSK